MFSRSRTMGGVKNTTYTHRYHSGGVLPLLVPNPVWIPQTATSNIEGWLRETHDTVVPNFAKLRKLGSLPNLAFSTKYREWTPSSVNGFARQVVGTYKSTAPAGYRWYAYDSAGDYLGATFGPICTKDGYFAYGVRHLDLDARAIGDEAIIKMWSTLEASSASALVTVAEAHKSLNLVTSAAQKLSAASDAFLQVVKLTKEVKSSIVSGSTKGKTFKLLKARLKVAKTDLSKILGKPTPIKSKKTYTVWTDEGAVKLVGGKPSTGYGVKTTILGAEVSKLSALTQVWLEWRYGWRILIMEIIDILKAIDEERLRGELPLTKGKEPGKIRRHIGYATASGVSETGTATASCLGPTVVNYTCEGSVNCRAYMHYVLSPGWSGYLARLNDFGLFNVPAALWDVVPLSFMADKVVDISSWLQAITPKVGITVLSTGLTTVTEETYSRTVVGWTSSPASGDLRWSDCLIPIGTQDRYLERSIDRRVNVSVPAFPPIRLSGNWKHVMDALALSTQSWGKIKNLR